MVSKVRVVRGKLVSGCHALVLTNPGNVPLHDVQQFLVDLLLIALLSALEDGKIHMQRRGTFNLRQKVISWGAISWNVLWFHVRNDLQPCIEKIVRFFVPTVLESVEMSSVE